MVVNLTCRLCRPPYAVNRDRNPMDTTNTFFKLRLIMLMENQTSSGNRCEKNSNNSKINTMFQTSPVTKQCYTVDATLELRQWRLCDSVSDIVHAWPYLSSKFTPGRAFLGCNLNICILHYSQSPFQYSSKQREQQGIWIILSNFAIVS